MGDGITYVGLDVHKEGIVVAVAEDGVRGEAREIKPDCEHADGSGSVGGKVGRDGVKLRFRYKAGPCGYGIQPFVGARHECVVEAPSLIPKRPGNRVKTNRRDGASLARLHRAGELTAVKVPDAEGEQRRDEPQRGYRARPPFALLDLGRLLLLDQPVQITKSTAPCRTRQQNLLNL